MATLPLTYQKEIGRSLPGLRAALQGELILPGDPGYEAWRRVWNAAIDRHPALIVRCLGANDVLRSVAFAREHDLDIAVRGGGHSTAGFSTCEGGVVIDLSPMKTITVNPSNRTTRAGAGLRLGELIRAIEPYGLATTTGTVADTGIAGLTLGGGLGWLMSKHGFTCDNVRSFEVITADGRLQRANADENPDLYWGLRGGGGNFGVVTAFEYRLHPLGTILGGLIGYPLSRARNVLRLYRDLATVAPDELGTMCFLGNGLDGVPMASIMVCYAGDPADGERVIAPLRNFRSPLVDLIRPMSYSALMAMLDPIGRPGQRSRNKESAVKELSDTAIDRLVDSAADRTSPLSKLLISHVHGAATRVGTGDTAFPYRDEHHQILHWASWEHGAGEEHVGWVRRSCQSLEPFATQRAYVNFMDDEGTARVRAAYGPNYDRLAALKSRYDPGNVFHLNQNIKPG